MIMKIKLSNFILTSGITVFVFFNAQNVVCIKSLYLFTIAVMHSQNGTSIIVMKWKSNVDYVWVLYYFFFTK